MRLLSHTEASRIELMGPNGQILFVDTTTAEFQNTVDAGSVKTGVASFRATLLQGDKWVDLEEVPDPCLTRGGESAQDYLARKEADPAMREALKRARQRAGDAAQRMGGGGLATLRLRAGLSQQQLAERMNTQQPAVARWERNPEQMQFPTICSMARALGVREQALFDAISNAGIRQEQNNAQQG